MAKNVTISIPDKLHADLQKNKEISISAVCQKALQESIAREDDLAKIGAERLRKERWLDGKQLRKNATKPGRNGLLKKHL